jgi:hypothetical protein
VLPKVRLNLGLLVKKLIILLSVIRIEGTIMVLSPSLKCGKDIELWFVQPNIWFVFSCVQVALEARNQTMGPQFPTRCRNCRPMRPNNMPNMAHGPSGTRRGGSSPWRSFARTRPRLPKHALARRSPPTTSFKATSIEHWCWTDDGQPWPWTDSSRGTSSSMRCWPCNTMGTMHLRAPDTRLLQSRPPNHVRIERLMERFEDVASWCRFGARPFQTTFPNFV